MYCIPYLKRLYLAFFLLVVMVLVIPASVVAHSGKYVPVVSINGSQTHDNSLLHYISPKNFLIANSIAPSRYYINQQLTFEGLANVYKWTFGDGSPSVTGASVSHAYTTPGTYFIHIESVMGDKTVDVVRIDVYPAVNYNLASLTIQVDDQPITKKFLNYINLQKKDNIRLEVIENSHDISQVVWEFGDGQIASGTAALYTYSGTSNSVSAIVHIIDKNNFVQDEVFYLIFDDSRSAENKKAYTISSNTPDAFNIVSLFTALQSYYRKSYSLLPLVSVVLVLGVYFLTLHYNVKSKQAVAPYIFSRFQPYARTAIYSVSVVWSLYLYYYAASYIPTTDSALAWLMRAYAFTALGLLFIVLTPGLLRVYIPTCRFNGILIYIRRALGLSMFFFASLHGLIGLLHNLSGSLSSIFFLAPRYQIALFCSGGAFSILSVLALTSSDKVLRTIGSKKWKMIHRGIYIAAILILFHAFFIGSHFTNPVSTVPLIVNVLALIYILLELLATYRVMGQTLDNGIRKKVYKSILLIVAVVAFFLSNYVLYRGPYDPHASHRSISVPDYEVRAYVQQYPIKPKMSTRLEFKVYDTDTNSIVDAFDILQERLMHIIVLTDTLEEYQHIHPTYMGNGTFSVETVFPREGYYYLYLEYAPKGEAEVVSIITIQTEQAVKQSAYLEVGPFKKSVGPYTIEHEPKEDILVRESTDFIYTIRETRTGKPITDLQPYLGAYGHLAAVSEDGEIFTHVHPLDIPKEKGGPHIRFNTLFQKPGKYVLFVQFKHNGQVFVTDFVVNVL